MPSFDGRGGAVLDREWRQALSCEAYRIHESCSRPAAVLYVLYAKGLENTFVRAAKLATKIKQLVVRNEKMAACSNFVVR